MKFPSALLFIYLSIYLSICQRSKRTSVWYKVTNFLHRSHFRHRVARTYSFPPPLLINHTSIRLVNPGIPLHAPHPRGYVLYTIYTGERVIIVGRYRGSTAEFCPLSP